MSSIESRSVGRRIGETLAYLLVLLAVLALFTILPFVLSVPLVAVVYVGLMLFRFERWSTNRVVPNDPPAFSSTIGVIGVLTGATCVGWYLLLSMIGGAFGPPWDERLIGLFGFLSLSANVLAVRGLRKIVRRDYAAEPTLALIAWDALARLPFLWAVLLIIDDVPTIVSDISFSVAIIVPGAVAWTYVSAAEGRTVLSLPGFSVLRHVVGAGGKEVPERFQRQSQSTANGRPSSPITTITDDVRTPDETPTDQDRPDAESTVDEWESMVPNIDFGDVGGMTALKDEFRNSVIQPLRNPDAYEEYDLSATNGILLYGPPGTGKTYVSKALAGELGYRFLELSPANIGSKWVGETAQNIETAFAAAKSQQPCLVFIDELDSIASSRDGQMTKSERDSINQLLVELQNVQGTDVVVVGATNYLTGVDRAVQRTGRFDLKIEVPPPDADARCAIFRVHLERRPVETSVTAERLIAASRGLVASDIEAVCDRAARFAQRRGEPISIDDIRSAIDDVRG